MVQTHHYSSTNKNQEIRITTPFSLLFYFFCSLLFTKPYTRLCILLLRGSCLFKQPNKPSCFQGDARGTPCPSESANTLLQIGAKLPEFAKGCICALNRRGLDGTAAQCYNGDVWECLTSHQD